MMDEWATEEAEAAIPHDDRTVMLSITQNLIIALAANLLLWAKMINDFVL